MSKLLSGSICLSDITKDKIFEAKSGKKYLNINVWLNDEADQYGNHASIQVNQSKEERDAKEKKVYIGNLKAVESTSVPKTSSRISDAVVIEDLLF